MTRRATWLLAAALAGCAPHDNATGGAVVAPVSVELMTLASTQVRDATEYLGTLQSRRSITLQPLVDGRLTRILVKSGDTVAAHQLLMQLDPARQRASVSSAVARRNASEAALAFASNARERAERLYRDGAISQQELEHARSSFDAARADARALAAQIEENAVELDYYRITAPACGVVGDIPVRVGDRVNPTTTLLTLDENELLEAYVAVPAEKAARLRVGMPIAIFTADGEALAEAKISFISPQVDEETESVLVKAAVQNRNAGLRPSQSVRARVIWSAREGLVVPLTAVLRLGAQSFVWVAEDKGGQLTAAQRPVTLGELGAEGYPVLGGVRVGERIVVGGVQKLADGVPLRVQPAPTAAAAAK